VTVNKIILHVQVTLSLSANFSDKYSFTAARDKWTNPSLSQRSEDVNAQCEIMPDRQRTNISLVPGVRLISGVRSAAISVVMIAVAGGCHRSSYIILARKWNGI